MRRHCTAIKKPKVILQSFISIYKSRVYKTGVGYRELRERPGFLTAPEKPSRKSTGPRVSITTGTPTPLPARLHTPLPSCWSRVSSPLSPSRLLLGRLGPGDSQRAAPVTAAQRPAPRVCPFKFGRFEVPGASFPLSSKTVLSR